MRAVKALLCLLHWTLLVGAMEDPFELDQQSLDEKLKTLQENFDRWRRIKSSAGAMTSAEELADAEDEFKWLTNEIHKSVKSVGWDLDDLGETLRRMSERRQDAGTKRHPKESTRAQYIKDSRDLLTAIEGEVRSGLARIADASEEASQVAAAPVQQQQPPPNSDMTMSASTERLVESLFQQDEEDDDDELLIRSDDEGSRAGRCQFGVAVDGAHETPLRRLWRRHRPVIGFVGLVLVLLLVLLIISLSSRGQQQPATATPRIATAAAP